MQLQQAPAKEIDFSSRGEYQSRLQATIIHLIRKERFYANMLLQMRRHLTNKVPTAGVNIKDGRIQLYINPTWFFAQTVEMQADVLKHECMHVLGSHFSRKDKNASEVSHRAWNIATDAAINCLLPELVKGMPECVSVERLSKEMGIKLEPMQHSEYYLQAIKEHLKDQQQQQTGSGGGLGDTVDDHGVWNEGETNPAVVDAVARQAARDAAKGLSAGEIPASAQDLINSGDNLVNWKTQLRRFVANAHDHVFEQTRTKRNRRYGLIFQGKRIDPKINLAVCFDTSGSMSDEMIGQCLSELRAIWLTGLAEITLIEADCSVQNVVAYKGETQLPFHGRGGTAYDPALKKAKELRADACIYFGDMDCADIPDRPQQMPVLWAIVGGRNAQPPVDWGSKIVVE